MTYTTVALPLVHEREAIRTKTDDIISDDITVPSKIPWVASIAHVKKKDGTLRFSVDYRLLDKIAKKVAYPLPRINDVFANLFLTKYFL